MSRVLLWFVLLTAVWLMALGQVSVGDLLIGLILSATLLWMFRVVRSNGPSDDMGRRVLWFGPFAVAALRKIVIATWDVSAIVLDRRAASPGYVEVVVGVRTTNGIIVTTWLTTLIPGSAMVEIDEERGVMIFHVLDAADPDAFRSSLDRFYERYQRHVFP